MDGKGEKKSTKSEKARFARHVALDYLRVTAFLKSTSMIYDICT